MRKILIVDDQAGIRLLLTDVFKGEGYEVHVAKTGKEALDKVCTEKYDLLILDYHLPIFNGEEVLNRMKEENVTIPTMIMTGCGEVLDKVFDQTYTNLVTVIAKPFDIKKVCRFVQTIFATNTSQLKVVTKKTEML